ncbi:MAG TPA: cupin domain-containing protein [Solirubrobacteraceae bacterium]|jgi:quercetin dioxygenase-like cupin family protein|nr:cupin domain-containing protein [Solirubrobacteraceae bacterium]
MDALVYGPGEGELHDAGPAQIVIKASGEHTGGSFFLSESTLAPGFAGPPPHRHRELHDMFYVLEGTLTLRLGDRTIEAPPGSFACVPPGVVHSFRNDSDGPVRLLNFNTPGGFENYMRDLTEAAQSEPLTSEVIARVASRYDFEFTR